MYKFHKTEGLIYVTLKFGLLRNIQFAFHLRSACLGNESGPDCNKGLSFVTFTLSSCREEKKFWEILKKNLASPFMIIDCVSRDITKQHKNGHDQTTIHN
jgi:hypothetical protein